MILRPYQLDAIQEVRDRIASGRRAPLVIAPTGAGKTVVEAELVRLHLEKSPSNRALVVAHRRELIGQIARTMLRMGVSDIGEIIPGVTQRPRARVQVASTQTLRARSHVPEATMVIYDEAHHYSSDDWHELTKAYPGVIRVGFTATPMRSDGRGMAPAFDSIVVVASIKELTALGHLVPCRVIAPKKPLRKPNMTHSPVDAYLDHAKGMRTVVFADFVINAEKFVGEFKEKGVEAVVVHGAMSDSDRRGALAAHARGAVLVNCMVLCLDDRTEILTSTGWIGIDAMADDCLVANWDAGRVTFEKPLEIVRRERGPNERMVSVEGERINARVTEGHRMLYRTTEAGPFLKAPARDLVGRVCKVPVSGLADPLDVRPVQPMAMTPRRRRHLITKTAYNLRKLESWPKETSHAEAVRRVDRKASLRHKLPSELTLDECYLIGFWIGDGSRCALQSGGVEYTIAQSYAYPRIVSWVDALIGRLGIHCVARDFAPASKTENASKRWSLPRGTGGGSQERSGLFSIEPYLDKNGTCLFWGLNSAQFDALIGGLWLADGDHGDGKPKRETVQIYSTNVAMLDLLQAIASVRGYGCSITKASPPRKSHHRQGYVLRLRKKESFHLTWDLLEIEPDWKPERVWCVKTRTKNIITRRGGKVLVMGNTEGWDSPSTACCILARGCGSVGTYLQIVGRVLRPAEGKAEALLIDLTGRSFYDHGAPDANRTYSLTGKGIRSKDDLDVEQSYCPVCGQPVEAAPNSWPCVVCGHQPSSQIDTPRYTGDELAERYAGKRNEADEIRIETLARWYAEAKSRSGERGRWAALAKYNAVYGAPASAVIDAQAWILCRTLTCVTCTDCQRVTAKTYRGGKCGRCAFGGKKTG